MGIFSNKHNFEQQEKNTYSTFSTLMEKVEMPNFADIDFHFKARELFPKFQECAYALKPLGFEVSSYGRTLQATMIKSKVSAENIWELEKKASEVALLYKFKPDGWGFSGP